MINSVRHTGIVVRNLVEAENFYCALGFVRNNKSIEQGNYIDTLVGIKNTKLEWVKLKAPDGYIIELLQYHSHPEKKIITNQRSNQLGCSHLAFSVDDINTICEMIVEMGGSIVNPPALSENNAVRVAYCHDIEGNLMEIVEVL